jgi:hypothetical protein
MTKLSKDLKRILAGLAQQDAGEYLSLREKMRVLGHQSAQPDTAAKHITASTKSGARRVALICGESANEAPLDYTIQTCSKNGAMIDLLVHNTISQEKVSRLEESIRAEGIECHTIRLGESPIESICTYIANHPSLIYMVSSPDNHSAKTLIDDLIPNQKVSIQVPFVLIESKAPDCQSKLSAA